MKKSILTLTLWCFLITNICGTCPVYAQFYLPLPGTMVQLSPAFVPAHLQGMTIDPNDPFKFDFLIHRGNEPLTEDQKKEEYTRLAKYFLASLTVPDQDQWVNLSPYEHDRIITENFGKTEMGRDLLAEDYLLKQITSSLMYPESGLGKEFWSKVYEQAWQQYHTTSVPVNTFNKVWIVPDQAVVYEKGNTAYIIKSHLKVMLEEDYLSMQKHQSQPTKAADLSRSIIRQIILPALEKEVNEGRNFALLRQIVSGMILATWYKKALKESLLGKIYADKNKIKGTGAQTLTLSPEKIYKRYLQAFKKGVYNYIKEDEDKYTHQAIPRKYFSGGFHLDEKMVTRVTDSAQIIKDPALMASVLEAKSDDMDQASFVLHGAAGDAAMAGGVPLSQRFDPEIDKLAGDLYKENRGTAIRFNERFREFLDMIDPDLGESMTFNNFYDIGIRFQAVFESGPFLDDDILKYAMSYFNDQAKRPAIFKDEDGLRVQPIMHQIIRHMIAAYYLRLLKSRKELDEKGEPIIISRKYERQASNMVDLIQTIWNQSFAPSYWIISKENGYFHHTSRIGHRSWMQIAELLTYLFGSRDHEDVRVLISSLNDISITEDERDRPRHLELIVPKIIMAMIPKLTLRPIIRTSTDPKEIQRLRDKRGDLQKLISELGDMLLEKNALRGIQKYKKDAHIILSDLFFMGDDEPYNWSYFSFSRYSLDDIWSLRENLTTAKLILAAYDYFSIHGDAPDDIPYIVDYFADNQDNFAMIATNHNTPRTISTASTLQMAKDDLIAELTSTNRLSAQGHQIIDNAVKRIPSVKNVTMLVQLAWDTRRAIRKSELKQITAVEVAFKHVMEFDKFSRKLPGVIDNQPMPYISSTQQKVNSVINKFSILKGDREAIGAIEDYFDRVIDTQELLDALLNSHHLQITYDAHIIVEFIEKVGGDAAMVPELDNNGTKGGIDLNSANLNLLIKRDGKGMVLPLVQQDMALLSRVQGFVPEIIAIRAVTSLPILNELKEEHPA